MITSRFSDGCLVIRFSACDEDGAQTARAGEYDSVLDVPVDNPSQIRTAINRVVASYQSNGPRVGEDEVIVQKMVLNTIMSGVVLSPICCWLFIAMKNTMKKFLTKKFASCGS